MATYVDITGASYPGEFNGSEITPLQGESLLPAFRGEDALRSKPLFWEWSEGQAMRDGQWKLVRWGKENSWDLYDISEDPTETNNLAASSNERVQAMEQQYLAWKKRVVSGSLN